MWRMRLTPSTRVVSCSSTEPNDGLLADTMVTGAAHGLRTCATPAIIGGRRLKVASTLAYDEFLNTLNWPLGAAVAVLLLAALVAIIWGTNRLVERRYAQVFA